MKCLITGGSSGIGKDMAKTLSLLGNEVILVSKDENKLISACEEIKNSHYYVCDLSYDVEVNKLCEYLLKEKPNIVINDAGFGAFGDYSEVSLEREMEMVKVNVISLHKITKTCLKDMEGTKKGFDVELYQAIQNIVSIPIIASGGMGNAKHGIELLSNTNVDAIATASVIHYDIDTIKNIKKSLIDNGVKVRV